MPILRKLKEMFDEVSIFYEVYYHVFVYMV